MVISVNENSYKCDTYEEYETCIGKAMEEENAEIWISESGSQDDLPCMSVLLKGDMAVINVFLEDGSNYVSSSGEDNDEIYEFCDGQYEVPDYQIIAKETALEAALHYFETEGMLDGIEWEEL